MLLKAVAIGVLLAIGISMTLRGTSYSNAYSAGRLSFSNGTGVLVVMSGCVVAALLLALTQVQL